MKIVIISSWPPTRCGIATYSADLVSALKQNKHQVDIICKIGNNNKDKNIYPILDLNDPYWPYKITEQILKLKPDIVHLQHEFALYTQVADKKCKIVRPADSFKVGELLFRLVTKNIPTVTTWHSLYQKMLLEEVEYYKLFMNLIDANIVHLDFQKKVLRDYYKIVPEKLINVIPHGTWIPKINQTKEKLRNQFNLPQDKFIFGMQGFLAITKGFERVFEIWPEFAKKYPNAHLVYAGDARPGSISAQDYKKKFLKVYNRIKDKSSITLINKILTNKEYPELLKTFDVAIFPYRFASQSGNLSKAYGLGLPIIVSDTPGLVSSVKKSKAGLIFKNDKDLFKYMEKMINNPQLVKKLSKKSYNYAKKEINWLSVAEKHIQVFKQAINKQKNISTDSRYALIQERKKVIFGINK